VLKRESYNEYECNIYSNVISKINCIFKIKEKWRQCPIWFTQILYEGILSLVHIQENYKKLMTFLNSKFNLVPRGFKQA
jgi:hypothetical protein